jgi:hypothetical protein
MVIAWIVLLVIASASFIIVGINMIAGLAWAYIALGIMLFGVAVFLRSGLKPNV